MNTTIVLAADRRRTQAGRWRRRVAFALIAALAVVVLVPMLRPESAAAAPGDPFDPAIGTVFVAQDAPTRLYIAAQGDGAVAFQPAGPTAAFGYNAVGFNIEDNYLYGLRRDSGNRRNLIRIGQDGVVTSLGDVAGLPVPPGTAVYNAGTFGQGATAGVLYVSTSAATSSSVAAIDVSAGTATRIPLSTSVPNLSDLFWKDGFLWGVNQVDRIYRIDPADGDVRSWPLGLGVSTAFGAQWVYGNGNVGLSANQSGTVYQFSITDPASSSPTFTRISSTAGPASPNNDGAAIPGIDVDLGIVKVGPAVYTPGSPLTYTLTVTNHGPGASSGYVHVYPKNAVTTATKTAVDADAVQLGDDVTFTISSDIPNADPIDGFRIVDVLDPKLDHVATVVTLADGTTIVEGVDYTVSHDAATNAVTVDFTADGRAILADRNTTRVVVDIVTTVNTIGEIVNQALVYPHAASFDIEPGEPGGPTTTPEVETRWGGITIEKVAEGGATLTGAVFQVFTSAADAAAQTNPVTLNGETEFEVVAADGTLTIEGLRYSDFANGGTVAPGEAGYVQYYLVEVQAPDGYELLAEPIDFTITAATTAAGIDLTVTNVPHNGGFQLPFTGGTGTGLLYLVGLGLIAGGIVFLVVRRRKNA